MSLSVVENIAVVLYGRLQLLLTPTLGVITASEVLRPLRYGGYTPKDYQIVLTQGETRPVEDLDYPGNPAAIAWETQFDIRCHLLPSEGSTTPLDTLVNQFTADVHGVVCSVNNWNTFGGYAFDAIWQSHEKIISDGSFSGVNVPIIIRYRTSETNLYTVRA